MSKRQVVDLTGDTDEEEREARDVSHLTALGLSPRSARAELASAGGDVARAADAHFFPPSKRARADPADAALARELAAADHRPDEAADAALAAALAENGTEEAGDAALATALATAPPPGGALDALVATGAIAGYCVPEPRPPVAGALAAIAHLLAAAGHDAPRLATTPVDLYPQPDGWSCGYRCLQSVVGALAASDPSAAAALRATGLLAPDGRVAAVRGLQTAIGNAWDDGFDAVGARQLGGAAGLAGSSAWIGPVEACVALRHAGLRANTRAADGKRVGGRNAARRIVDVLAAHFDGASPPPALLCFGGHNVLVVGVVDGPRLVVLDPKWRAPRLRLAAAADLDCRRGQYEALLVSPGTLPLAAMPRDPDRTA